MDLTTIIGVILGIVAVIIGMYFKGVPFSALVNPAAFTIIILGTIAVIVIAFPGKELKNIGKYFGILFGNKKLLSSEKAVEIMVECAETARRSGLLALESRIDTIEDPFLRHGIQLLVDTSNPETIRDILTEDVKAMEERHAVAPAIFSQAGTYAPTLGVLGAVLGLIAALSEINDTEAVGIAISAAFVATLLGIFTGYVLWNPFANKLKRKSAIEVSTKMLIIEGICSIATGYPPRQIQENLLSYLKTV